MTEKRNRFGRLRLSRREVIAGGVGAALVGAGYLLGELDWEDSEDWEKVGDDPLKIYSGHDDTANRQRMLLIDQWNKMHEDFPALMVELPSVADLQYSAIHARLQAEDPAVDIVNLDVPWIAEFAGEGYLHELEGVDTSGFIERPLDAGIIDNHTYALPFNSDVGMLYYRKDLVGDEQEATLKELSEWGELLDLLKEILPGSDFEGGIAMQLAPYEGFTVNVWEYLLANGITTGENGSIDFGEGSRALELLEDLAGFIHPELLPEGDDHPEVPYILPSSLSLEENGSLAAFQAGLVPFLRHWPRAFQQLQNCEADFEVGVVPMPGGVLGGQSLAVSAFSERKNVSQALIEFLTGPISQQLLFERGGFASTRDEPYFDAIAQVENIVEGNGDEEPPERLCAESGAVGPRFEAEQLHNALERAGLRPSDGRYTQFSRVFQAELHPELEGPGSPELDDLAAKLEAAAEGR